MNFGVAVSIVWESLLGNRSLEAMLESFSGLILKTVFGNNGGLRLFEVSCAIRMVAGLGKLCFGPLSAGFMTLLVAQDESPAKSETAISPPKIPVKKRCPNPITGTVFLGGLKSHID